MIRPRVVTFVVALAMPLSSAVVAQTQQTTTESVIVAQGEASLTEAPDRAYVQIATEGRGSQPTQAQRVSADAMTAVQAALKRLGLPADAMRTTGYSVLPEYDFVNGRQTFRDYLSRHQIEVRVDDITRLADVLDTSGASGAAFVSSLRFDVKNRATVEREALRRAVQDAIERAQAIAAGAGRTVGAIVRLQEQRTSPPTAVQFQGGGGGGGRGGGGVTPVAPGEIEIHAQVTLTIAIAGK